MKLVFLSTPPSFSVMVTCRIHPVPPIRQASSAGSPQRQAAPSASLLSPSSSARAATGLAPVLILLLLLLLLVPRLGP